MPEKDTFILNDPFDEPTEQRLKEFLHDRYEWLQIIRRYALSRDQGVMEIWKYYNDVKQWLFRLKNKKDTLCWIGFLPDTFRVTCYFSSKYENAIENSDLPVHLREAYQVTRDQTFRPISIRMEHHEEVAIVCKLIDMKLNK